MWCEAYLYNNGRMPILNTHAVAYIPVSTKTRAYTLFWLKDEIDKIYRVIHNNLAQKLHNLLTGEGSECMWEHQQPFGFWGPWADPRPHAVRASGLRRSHFKSTI